MGHFLISHKIKIQELNKMCYSWRFHVCPEIWSHSTVANLLSFFAKPHVWSLPLLPSPTLTQSFYEFLDLGLFLGDSFITQSWGKVHASVLYFWAHVQTTNQILFPWRDKKCFLRKMICIGFTILKVCGLMFSSVQFSSITQSCPTLSDPMDWLHARPPFLTSTPRVYSNSCPLIWWCHPTISFSVIPFSSFLQSFPVSVSFHMSQFFASGGQSIGASASVLPMNIKDWFPLGLTGWISLKSKGLSRVFSNTTVQKHQFFSTQFSL